MKRFVDPRIVYEPRRRTENTYTEIKWPTVPDDEYYAEVMLLLSLLIREVGRNGRD